MTDCYYCGDPIADPGLALDGTNDAGDPVTIHGRCWMGLYTVGQYQRDKQRVKKQLNELGS